ncbi:glutathione S-transferase [Aspergillus egyptiacus]|nr:glutathione S-transferase [Aspergillus egyptiacus]
MAPFGTIYSYPDNPRVQKIRAVANINGLTIDDAEFKMGETNRTEDFLSKFPMGKAPAFSSADGVHIFESNAIAHYVADSGPAREQLLGANPAERARVQQWVTMSEGEVFSHIVTCLLPRLGYVPFNQAAEDKALSNVDRALGALEKALNGRTWLATEKLSLADISVAAALVWGFKLVLDSEIRAKYPVLMAWYKRVMDSEGVKEAFGETTFIEKRQVPQ